MSPGIFRNAGPRSGSSDLPPYYFENKCPPARYGGFQVASSWQREELVLHNSAVLFSIPTFVPKFCLYQLALICKEPMPNSSNFRRELKMFRLEQVDLQKRVLMSPTSSVQQAADAANHSSSTRNTHRLTGNRIIQSCSQCQAHGTLVHLS